MGFRILGFGCLISSDAIFDGWNLLTPGCPRNVEKLTKAPLFLDSMKSLDLPPDLQHFTKVAKMKSPSLKVSFCVLNILTKSEIRRAKRHMLLLSLVTI